MAAYLVNHRYRAGAVAFAAGDAVDLDPEAAEHINRDSPGCLSPVETAAPPVDPTPEPDSVDDDTAAASGETAVAAMVSRRKGGNRGA